MSVSRNEEAREEARLNREYAFGRTLLLLMCVVLGCLFTFAPEFTANTFMGGADVLPEHRAKLNFDFQRGGGAFFLLGFLLQFAVWMLRSR